MKRHLCFLLVMMLLCSLLLTGCHFELVDKWLEHKIKLVTLTIEEVTDLIVEKATDLITEEVTDPTTEETTDPATEETTEPTTEVTTEPTTEETTAPPTETTEPPKDERPFAVEYPYLEEIPAEACVFAGADSTSAFVQTIGADGTFTITEEVRDVNGDLWGRLKSGVGWVNLSDPYCHGTQLPPVTISRAGRIVLNSDHHSAEVHTEYQRKISFVAHETVTDLRIVFVNAGEMGGIVYTMERLEPGKPLVAHLSYAGDFYGYYFCYKDVNGIEHSNYIGESLRDGSLYVQY